MKYGKVFPHILFAVLVGAFVLINNPDLISNKFNFSSPNTEIIETKETAKVRRVIDGDTIEVLLNNKKDAVRLIGIDAPETDDPRKTVECFGREASDKAKEVLNGKTITLESDPTQGDRDKYHRLLRYVFLNDLNFNKFMISEGYAHEYTYKSNPYKYMEEFINAEKEARKNKKGLWNENVCKNP
ncbi:MAG: thermonuclease family protein [Candidatus Levybacteria bacterium]|nr:thermonuclease family protein [Candidatus Levybacteria bacterium]